MTDQAQEWRSFGFVLSTRASDLPATFSRSILGDWHLGHAEGLTATGIRVAGYDEVLLLSVVPPDSHVQRSVGDLAEIDDQMIGGFVLFLRRGTTTTVRHDACGMSPVVFSPADKVVASCPSLIAAQGYAPERTALPRGQDTFFPFGLTAKPGVRRLLPNHTLCLDDFSARRVWRIEDLPANGDPETLADEITECLQQSLKRLHALAPLRVPLTAGRDSRALIACCTGLTEVRSHTNLIDDDALWDGSIAARIAKDMAFDYRGCPFRKPEDRMREQWLERIGYSVGGRVSYGFLTAPQDTAAWLVTGLCGEIGRNYYPTPDRRPDPAALLDMLKVETNADSLHAAEAWLQPLKALDARQLADLLYLEIRLGCWAGPQMACPGPVLGRVAPFGHRRIVDGMLRTPAASRANHRIPHRIIARANPRLLRFRFSPRGKRETLRVGLERAGLHMSAQAIAKAFRH